MTVHDAIHEIMDNWDDWEAEAGQQAQIEQDPEYGEYVMRQRLRAVLLRFARSAFDAGFKTCRSYGDNHHHYEGGQADVVFAKGIGGLL